VKQTLQTLLHIPMSKQRLFFNGRELSSPSSSSSSTLSSAGIRSPPSLPASSSSSSSSIVSKRRHTTGGAQEGGREGGSGGGGGGGGGLRELNNYGHSLQDCGIIRDGETIYFTIARPPSLDLGHSGPILRPYGLLQPPRRLGRAFKQVRIFFFPLFIDFVFSGNGG